MLPEMAESLKRRLPELGVWFEELKDWRNRLEGQLRAFTGPVQKD